MGFGTASFTLRSRSLLTVSTAALLTDLGFVVFRIGTTAPTVLWVLGLVFGLALMAVAAWLEHPAGRRAPADPPLRPRAPRLELKTLPFDFRKEF